MADLEADASLGTAFPALEAEAEAELRRLPAGPRNWPRRWRSWAWRRHLRQFSRWAEWRERGKGYFVRRAVAVSWVGFLLRPDTWAWAHTQGWAALRNPRPWLELGLGLLFFAGVGALIGSSTWHGAELTYRRLREAEGLMRQIRSLDGTPTSPPSAA